MNNVTSLRTTPLITTTTFDQNTEETEIEPKPPFIANHLSQGINVCDINVCVRFNFKLLELRLG